MTYTIVLALSVSYFLAFLDQTILSTLTPRVANDQDDLFQTTWVTASYLASLSAFMLLYGKVAEIFGPLPVLIVALLIFLCGSALTAAATTMTWLILARAFAGMGAGGLTSITQIMAAEIGPWRERGQYMGILGAVFGLSTTIGPLAGGLVADKWTWRYSFYVNVPLVCLTLIVLLLLVRVKAYPLPFREKIARVDFFGALMLVTGLMLLLLGLNWGGRVYLWVSPVVIICISVGLLLLGVFIFVELKLAIEPIIDPRLFRVRNVALIIPIEVCVGAVFFNAIFNLPAYYSFTQNSTASQSGVHMVPIACGVVVCSIVSGWLIARYNMYRLIAWVGTVSLTLGAGLLCLFDAHLSTAAQVPIMALLGSGIGCCIQTFLLTVQASVKPTDLAITTAFATFSQMSGGILGLAFGGVLSESTTKHHLLRLMNEYPAYTHLIREAKNDVNDLWSMDLPQHIRNGIIAAYIKGLKHNLILFTCLGAITVVLSAFIDRVPPPKSSPGSLGHAQPAEEVGIDEVTVAGLHRRHHGYDEIQELQAIEARSRNAAELSRREYEEVLRLEW
ncbi:MFS general substrate transporter [Linderina pennispora]|uniref:MFS general substrate transporter n=1 Tax=Linderina pennispora TaxID=61395 RepID=A0A1Y1W7X5_9FUNG|nr:MFS general substrate transporter [Linderina pennispora]ORX69631.1 MFS general substrate transporter [Linderina pennispora]